ncbi:MAG: class II fructose-bisphosphate aldolase [Geobacter sp.]|nr:class II fructose-bisphosphate aldolase [Geobacter sp.]
MNKTVLEITPERIRNILGSQSRVCLMNGKDVFQAFREEKSILMACNPRIKHVIPGIMKAAQELDATVAFELTRTEGGLDSGYTGQSPAIFVNTILEYAESCGFTKPFIIHGDHIIVRDESAREFEAASKLIEAQIEAGYTSFAIDASFNPLPEHIRITTELARPILEEGLGLEVEIGEALNDKGKPTLTTVEETEAFLDGLIGNGVQPQMLSIENGSKRGNYLEGEMVAIDLERTRQIYETAAKRGLSGLVQHGITGTPLRLVGKLLDYGIRKGNIGTLWQNVAHAGLPLDLMDAMRRWARDNGRDIKYATAAFKAEIDSIPGENARQIMDMAYRESKEFLTAFHAQGSASRVMKFLGQRP